VLGQGGCSETGCVGAASCSVSSAALVKPTLTELLGPSLLRTSHWWKINLQL